MVEHILKSLNNLKTEFKKIKVDARGVKDKSNQETFETDLYGKFIYRTIHHPSINKKMRFPTKTKKAQIS